MMTIRQVREAVAGLIRLMPESPLPPGEPKEFFGSNPALEQTIQADLARGLAGLEDWPAGLSEATLPHIKFRLMFAAECLRQTEEAHPEFGIDGAEIPELLRHWMIDQWPEHGVAWATATFGPRRRLR